MKLLALRIIDFLSIEQLSIDLEQRRGLVLVTGPNGSGKTNIIAESIYWVLFGKTLRGLTLAEVVREGSRQAEVRLLVEIDEKPIRIIRRAAVAGMRNIHPLEVDGIEAAATKTEVEAQLRDLLPLTETVFRTIFLFAEGFEQSFAQLSKRARAELIESLVGCEALDGAHARAKKGREILLGKIEAAKGKIANAERIRARFAETGTGASQRRMEEIETREAEVVEVSRELGEHIQAAVQEPAVTNQDQIERMAAADVARWQAAETHLKSERARMQAFEGSAKCPTCRQAVSAEHVHDTVLSIDVELESVSGQKVSAEQCHEEAKAATKQLRDQQEAHRRWLEKRDRLRAKVKSAQDLLAVLQKNAAAEQQQQQRQLSDVESEISAAVREHQTHAGKLPYLDFWVKAFSVDGIRSYRLDGVLDWLNGRLQAYSEALFDGAVISLSPEKQGQKKATNEISVVVSSLKGRRYEAASRGQRRKIDLALHLALQDLAWHTSRIRCNILVCDEVLDSLDEDSAKRAIALLDERSRQIGTVFLVSHEDKAVKSRVSRVWRVSAPQGITMLEDEGEPARLRA